jgi:hypothetical protein
VYIESADATIYDDLAYYALQSMEDIYSGSSPTSAAKSEAPSLEKADVVEFRDSVFSQMMKHDLRRIYLYFNGLIVCVGS